MDGTPHSIIIRSAWLLIFSLVIGCHDQRPIKILFAPEDLFTISDVSCESFEYECKSTIRGRIISNVDLKDSIIERIERLEPQLNVSGIDTRIKLFIPRKNNDTDTLCLGRLQGVYLNGVEMKDDSLLLSMVEKEVW